MHEESNVSTRPTGQKASKERGYIYMVNRKRGFGFIQTHESFSRRLFFHFSSVIGIDIDDLRIGMDVTFTTQRSDHRLSAIGVMIDRDSDQHELLNKYLEQRTARK